MSRRRDTSVFESSRSDAVRVGDLRQWEEAFLLGESHAERVEIEWLMGDKTEPKDWMDRQIELFTWKRSTSSGGILSRE